jgi:hypothetical protein
MLAACSTSDCLYNAHQIRCQSMQAQPADVSLALYTFVRLAYEPVVLLEALEDGLPLRVHAFVSDPESCVKICWCMATFNSFRPRLFAVAMQAMCVMEEDHFSNAMLYEVTVAHKLATHAECAFPCSCATRPCAVIALTQCAALGLLMCCLTMVT